MACCSWDHVVYIITHNVSSDQSPITVNRTNVTLYGVQPGVTYTVEITPSVTNNSTNCSGVSVFSHKETTFAIDSTCKWG